VNIPEIKVLPNPAAIAAEGAERFATAYAEVVASRGSFSVALSGGSTPKAMHAILAAESYKSRIDWTKVHVFFGDERCVPPDHKDSNYRMALETLLSKVPIPLDNIYRMEGELDPHDAAAKYEEQLREYFDAAGGFDLCYLGMGDDGHTLSLFPNTPAIDETKKLCVAQHVAKSTTGDSWRITLTAPFVNRSHRVLFLVAGVNKSKALTEVLEGDRDVHTYPSQLIAPEQGQLTFLIDPAAAGMT
jgi:6-phosphogluconolactonase